MATADEVLIDRVMTKLEDFYFTEGEDGGEAIFARFAEQHHHVFNDLLAEDTDHV